MASLAAMPAEIIDNVCENLDRESILALRLCCRGLAKNTFGGGFAKLFSSIKVMLHPVSLELLDYIARHEDIANKVKKFTLSSESLHNYEPEEGYIECLSQDWQELCAQDALIDNEYYLHEKFNIVQRFRNITTVRVEDPWWFHPSSPPENTSSSYTSAFGHTLLEQASGIGPPNLPARTFSDFSHSGGLNGHLDEDTLDLVFCRFCRNSWTRRHRAFQTVFNSFSTRTDVKIEVVVRDPPYHDMNNFTPFSVPRSETDASTPAVPKHLNELILLVREGGARSERRCRDGFIFRTLMHVSGSMLSTLTLDGELMDSSTGQSRLSYESGPMSGVSFPHLRQLVLRYRPTKTMFDLVCFLRRHQTLRTLTLQTLEDQAREYMQLFREISNLPSLEALELRSFRYRSGGPAKFPRSKASQFQDGVIWHGQQVIQLGLRTLVEKPVTVELRISSMQRVHRQGSWLNFYEVDGIVLTSSGSA